MWPSSKETFLDARFVAERNLHSPTGNLSKIRTRDRYFVTTPFHIGSGPVGCNVRQYPAAWTSLAGVAALLWQCSL